MGALLDTDIMDFGMYKGTRMDQLPSNYLEWLAGEIKPKAPNKRSAFEAMFMKWYEDRTANPYKKIIDSIDPSGDTKEVTFAAGCTPGKTMFCCGSVMSIMTNADRIIILRRNDSN